MSYLEDAKRIDWQEFNSSPEWKIICKLLDDIREEGFVILSSESDLHAIHSLRGRIGFCTEMKTLPLIIEERLKDSFQEEVKDGF